MGNRPRRTDIDLHPRRKRDAAEGATRQLLCLYRASSVAPDALISAGAGPIRGGIIARMAYREAAGCLAFVRAWVDPPDLALRDLGLTLNAAVGL